MNGLLRLTIGAPEPFWCPNAGPSRISPCIQLGQSRLIVPEASPLHTREVAGSKPAAPIVLDGRRGWFLHIARRPGSGHSELSPCHLALPWVIIGPGVGNYRMSFVRILLDGPRCRRSGGSRALTSGLAGGSFSARAWRAVRCTGTQRKSGAGLQCEARPAPK
jgi:hypothetical protein